MTVQRRRLVLRIALAVALATVVAVAWHPVRASLFGEENATLIQQLAELMRIHHELETVSDAARQGAEAAEDLYAAYDQARAAVDEIKHYSTDKFLRDVRADFYEQYPGFERMADYAGTDTARVWRNSRAESPFSTYELIGAAFGDLTEPLKARAAEGDLPMRRAVIQRFEAAGALAAANAAEAWTQSADDDALELYRLAADADADQAAHLSARALALIAVQQSHVIRLLSRDLRLDGVEAGLAWAKRVESLNELDRMKAEVTTSLQEAAAPPPMMHFGNKD